MVQYKSHAKPLRLSPWHMSFDGENGNGSASTLQSECTGHTLLVLAARCLYAPQTCVLSSLVNLILQILYEVRVFWSKNLNNIFVVDPK